MGRVKGKNAGTQGSERKDTIPITIILVKIDEESPETANFNENA